MDLLTSLPTAAIAPLIFAIRVLDVSMGTLRTVCVVQGRLKFSVILGFFEILIWIVAISQLITRVSDSPILMLAYAGGFSAGNAVGISLERILALGEVVVRVISTGAGGEIAEAMRAKGHRVTTFEGQGRDGPVVLIYTTCRRRDLRQLVKAAQDIDPSVFYAVEPVQQQRDLGATPLPHATGWRAVFKKK